MKTGMIGLVLMAAGFASFAQSENDDMYFNAKDRAKQREAAKKEMAQRDLRMNEESKKMLSINPTDSYSSKNINPEYASRQRNASNEQSEDVGYFQPGYQPQGVNQALRNNNYNAYNNAFYGNSYYGNSWANPYYGYTSGFGSPYGSFYPSMWGSPYGGYYGGTGWSMSMGYSWGYPSYGMGWNSWGMPSSLFWNNYYGYGYGYNPYNSWGSGWGYPYYGNYYNSYYPVVVDNGNGPHTVYGKRNDRSSSLNNDVDNSRPTTAITRNGREISSGRTRNESAQPTYYDRSWRQNQELNQNQTRTYWGNESNTTRTYSGNNNNNNNTGRQRTSTWSNDNSFFNNDNNNRSTPSRSWSNDNSSLSGGSRSHSSPSPSHSSGGTRSRGRD